MTRIKRYLEAAIVGAVAFSLMWIGWHLWLDHQNFHALLNWANQVASQAQQAKGGH